MRAALYAFYNLQLLSCFRGICDCANCTNDKFKLLLSGSFADLRKLFCPKIRQPNMEAVSPLPGNEDGQVKTGPVFLHKKACCISPDKIKCKHGGGHYCKQYHLSEAGPGAILCPECPINDVDFCEHQKRYRGKITVCMYDKVDRGNGFYQVEMKDKMMRPSELFDHLRKTLYCYMAHYVTYEWYMANRNLTDMKATPLTAQLGKDFAAGISVTAQDNVTCSTANTAVLEEAVLSYNPRIVIVPEDKRKKLKAHKKIVWTTHVFHAIGASSSKHKDNDAAFHFPVMCHVILFFITWCCAQVQQTNPFTAPAYTNDPQKSAAENKKAKEKQYEEKYNEWKKKFVLCYIIFFLFTDGCSGQYYGCKAFYFFSLLFKLFGIRIHHLVAVPGKFKGPWDSFGHVFKKMMRSILLKRPDTFDVDGVKTVNLPAQYFKLAFNVYPKPTPTKNIRHYHKYTNDERSILFVAYTQRVYNTLRRCDGGKYANNILLNDRSKRVYDMKMAGSRSMDYVYNREDAVNYARSSYCFGNCCWDGLVLNDDISVCKNCKHQDWTGGEMKRYQSPTYNIAPGLTLSFRSKLKKGVVVVSPIPDSLIESMASKSRPYGYEICYYLLLIESKPYTSPYEIGTKFLLNGHRNNETYYDMGTWVVKVRFAAYQSQLVWRWEKEYAVVQCAALADTDFEIQVRAKRQSASDKKLGIKFSIDGETHDKLCTLDGIDDSGNDRI